MNDELASGGGVVDESPAGESDVPIDDPDFDSRGDCADDRHIIRAVDDDVVLSEHVAVHRDLYRLKKTGLGRI